ncbi:MAG: TetR/AcrR family transcriptional regulator [bacterium]|nr:TetR/AcrR family transcriptional regulator [bacterium]
MLVLNCTNIILKSQILPAIMKPMKKSPARSSQSKSAKDSVQVRRLLDTAFQILKSQILPAIIKPVKKSPVRPYLGESAKDRVQARRRLLMDTAFQLLASDGWRKVTIENICSQAKLNKRYFYESFSDLDDLFAAVVDELASGLVETAFKSARAARQAGLSTEDFARAAMTEVVKFITDDPRRARVLFTEIADSPRAVAHRRAVILGLAKAISAYGYEYHNVTGTDTFSELASALLIGGSIEVILGWLDGNIAISREHLIDDLAALWIFVGDGVASWGKARKKARANSRKGR